MQSECLISVNKFVFDKRTKGQKNLDFAVM